MFNNFNFFKNEVESEEELRDKEKRVAWSYKFRLDKWAECLVRVGLLGTKIDEFYANDLLAENCSSRQPQAQHRSSSSAIRRTSGFREM